METVTIQRNDSADSGTFGLLLWCPANAAALRLVTLELPDRDNQPNRSRIPAGRYRCLWQRTHSKGMRYCLQGVPGRSGILIHAGNWAGDVEKGLRSDTQGCILLGLTAGPIKGQPAIQNSRRALAAFEALMQREPFDLVICD